MCLFENKIKFGQNIVEFVEIVEKPMKTLHILKGIIVEISTMIVDIVEIFQRYQGYFKDISTISQFDICNKFRTISTIATISRIIPEKYKILVAWLEFSRLLQAGGHGVYRMANVFN
jgi:hypothetical protein